MGRLIQLDLILDHSHISYISVVELGLVMDLRYVYLFKFILEGGLRQAMAKALSDRCHLTSQKRSRPKFTPICFDRSTDPFKLLLDKEGKERYFLALM